MAVPHRFRTSITRRVFAPSPVEQASPEEPNDSDFGRDVNSPRSRAVLEWSYEGVRGGWWKYDAENSAEFTKKVYKFVELAETNADLDLEETIIGFEASGGHGWYYLHLVNNVDCEDGIGNMMQFKDDGEKNDHPLKKRRIVRVVVNGEECLTLHKA